MERKQVPNFPGYFCTTAGQIFSFKKGREREVKGSPDKDGYLKVALVDSAKKRHDLRKHRVIAFTFLGASDLQINHKNGIRTDNRADNLEYVTQQENQCHRRLKEGHDVGVCWARKEGKWRAYFQQGKKWEHLGFYDTKEQAKAAYLARLDEGNITNRYDGRY